MFCLLYQRADDIRGYFMDGYPCCEQPGFHQVQKFIRNIPALKTFCQQEIPDVDTSDDIPAGGISTASYSHLSGQAPVQLERVTCINTPLQPCKTGLLVPE